MKFLFGDLLIRVRKVTSTLSNAENRNVEFDVGHTIQVFAFAKAIYIFSQYKIVKHFFCFIEKAKAVYRIDNT